MAVVVGIFVVCSSWLLMTKELTRGSQNAQRGFLGWNVELEPPPGRPRDGPPRCSRSRSKSRARERAREKAREKDKGKGKGKGKDKGKGKGKESKGQALQSACHF
jgi:hypothetical protein